MRRFLRRVGGGGGPEVFPPLSDLQLWLINDTIKDLAPDAQIASWPNSHGVAGNADQSIAANRPHRSPENTFNPNTPTGQVGVSFNQAIPFYSIGSLPAAPGLDISRGLTCFLWAYESQFAAAGQVVWQDQAGGSPQLLLQGNGGGIGLRDAISTRYFGTLPLASFYSAVWSFAGPNGGTGTFEMWLNGAVVGTSAWNFGSLLETAYFLGANQVANAGYAGMMYEFRVYNSSYSPGLIRSVLSYGKGRYGF